MNASVSGENTRPRVLRVLGILGLIALVVIAFEPVRHNEFINIDDPYYIEGNPMVNQGFSAQGLHWAFSTVLLGNWNPVTWMAHMLDAQLFGVKNAGAHHVTSAVYHGLTAVILFAVFWRYTRDPWKSFLLAAFFAVHPLRVESVAWASEKKDVVSGVWWMLTLLFYERWISNKGSGKETAAGLSAFLTHLFFILGLLSKPVCVTLPAVLILLDYWPLGRLRNWVDLKALISEKGSLFVITFVSALWTYTAQHHEGATSGNSPMVWHLLNGLWNYTAYIGKMFWPTELGFYYGWFSHKELIVYGLLSTLLLGVITGVILRQGAKRPALAFGWFWYLGTMLPMVGILQVGAQSMADRYTYIPQIGIVSALLWGLSGLWKKLGYLFVSILAGVLLICCIFLTRKQITYWKTSEGFWEHSISVSRPNVTVLMNLGMSLMRRQDSAAALETYKKALAIAPDSSLALTKIGDVHRKQRRYDEARKYYEQAAALDPDDLDILFELGHTYTQMGNPEMAMEYYEKILEKKSDHIRANFFVSEFYAEKGQTEEREKYLARLLKIRPFLPEEYNLKGLALYKQGDWESATWNFKMAIDMQRMYDSAHYNLANAYVQLKDYANAKIHFAEALRINPDFASAANDYGALLQNMGQTEQAMALYRQAIDSQPSYGDAYYNLGNAYAAQNRNAEAAENYQKALDLMFDFASVHNNLAIVLEKEERYPEALEHYEAAIRLEPQNQNAHYNLGNLYLKMGAFGKAREHYREILRQEPGHERARGKLLQVEALLEGEKPEGQVRAS